MSTLSIHQYFLEVEDMGGKKPGCLASSSTNLEMFLLKRLWYPEFKKILTVQGVTWHFQLQNTWQETFKTYWANSALHYTIATPLSNEILRVLQRAGFDWWGDNNCLQIFLRDRHIFICLQCLLYGSLFCLVYESEIKCRGSWLHRANAICSLLFLCLIFSNTLF